MDFTLQPDLEEFAAVSVAIKLWESPDIRKQLAEYVLTYPERATKTINEPTKDFARRVSAQNLLAAVKTKANEHCLTKPTKDLVHQLVRNIGSEIYERYQFIFKQFGLDFDFFLDHLKWTPWGKIDLQQTADYLMDDDRLPHIQRYSLARQFCCEECDPHLWKKMTDEMTAFQEAFDVNIPMIPVYFHQRCREDFPSSNRISFQRFWFSLSGPRKSEIIQTLVDSRVESFGIAAGTDIHSFLITQMDNGQQRTFFGNNFEPVLQMLTNDYWRRRKFLISAVKIFRDFMSDHDLYQFLHNFAAMEVYCDFGFDDSNLVGKVWIESPIGAKRMAVQELFHNDNGVINEQFFIMSNFITTLNATNVKLFFKAVNVEERENFIEILTGFLLNRILRSDDGEWDLLESFIKHVLPSEKDVAHLKCDFLYSSSSRCCENLTNQGQWLKLSRCLKWALAE